MGSDVTTQNAVFEDSNPGFIEISGADRVRFLHNLSTNNIEALKPGQTQLTTVTNQTGRTLELLTVLAGEDSLSLLFSGESADSLYSLFDMYIFPRDKVAIDNRSDKLSAISVFGDLSILSDQDVLTPERGCFTQTQIDDTSVTIIHGSGLTLDGFTVLAEKDQARKIVSFLTKSGFGNEINENEWDLRRILDGRPLVGKELTEDFNPLEAGLWKTVSFIKGCYIGQETIAKLKTYDGVKQNLYGVEFSEPVPVGEKLFAGDNRAGVVTSCIAADDGKGIGLAYIRRKFGGAGLQVQAQNGVKGVVQEIPFATRTVEECADPVPN
ncbi:hypothetical protein NDN08_006542 [Rhodosorus marinus]|uniref:GCVT N-terminal domain-containing protein n=1 Tax=Rhodosorus marinus TaxID=101924 RepID=A0AAV8UI26_9RHOD|nr:hypothetical protein NDN08_006542 [Rhodosorus marinus]